MSRLEFILYKGHPVEIGIPYIGDSTKLFWVNGLVTSVDDDSLLLKKGDFLKRIYFKEIREIHLDTRSR